MNDLLSCLFVFFKIILWCVLFYIYEIYRVPRVNSSRVSLQYLLHYLVSVKSLVNRHAWSRTPVAETSWALLRDCYHGDMCIRHSPQHLAVAALYLALNTYGVELPVGEKEWWQVRIRTLAGEADSPASGLKYFSASWRCLLYFKQYKCFMFILVSFSVNRKIILQSILGC